MSLSDTAEYWNDVKSNKGYFPKHVFTHIKKGPDCGHFHVSESEELKEIDCYACIKIIENDFNLKTKLELNNGKRERKRLAKKSKKSGYKLNDIIKFGKYKGQQKTINWIFENDTNYLKWLLDKVLFNPEVKEKLTNK